MLLLIGAFGIVVIGAMHSFLGEKYIFPRLLRLDLPRLRGSVEYTRGILRWAWHLTSLAWWGFAFLLFAIAAGKSIDATFLARSVGVVFGLTGLVCIATTRGRHVAWPLLLLVAIACWWGAP